MEIIAFGGTCFRLKGREGVVVTDPFPSIVGPTGRGLSGDIVTYSHSAPAQTLGLGKAAAKGAASRRAGDRKLPTSLDGAFLLDSPGEYEVHEVLVTGVRTYRDDQKGEERGSNTCFVFELDGLHAIHLGDIGHLLTEDMLGEVGTVDIVCVPVGGSLPGARAAELVAQLDAQLILPMQLTNGSGGAGEMERFLHEMSAQHPEPVAKLTVTISSLPQETTVVMLEPRARG